MGFGDFYPITHFGRFVVVLASFWGMVMVSQFVYTMEISSNFTLAQSKAFELFTRLKSKHILKREAASLIFSWWKYLKIKNNPEELLLRR